MIALEPTRGFEPPLHALRERRNAIIRRGQNLLQCALEDGRAEQVC